MITIKMYQGKWRISIDQEVWEMDKTEAKKMIDSIIESKEKYGRLKGGEFN